MTLNIPLRLVFNTFVFVSDINEKSLERSSYFKKSINENKSCRIIIILFFIINIFITIDGENLIKTLITIKYT